MNWNIHTIYQLNTHTRARYFPHGPANLPPVGDDDDDDDNLYGGSHCTCYDHPSLPPIGVIRCGYTDIRTCKKK